MTAGESARHAPRSRRGRLTVDREQDIHGAALALLQEVGYDALTMDEVAARARASKATLYRRWKGKAQLMAAALRYHAPDENESDTPDTGSLVGDLHEIARRACETPHREELVVLRALGRATHAHPELADAVCEYTIKPGMEALRTVLDRAIARGEVAPDNPALAFVPHLISGATLTRPALEQTEADRAFLSQYVDAVVLPTLLQRHH